jgi:linoleoyl-CoA desaturase
MFSASAWPNVLAVQLAVPAGLWVGQWTLKHRVHHRLSQVYPVDENTRSTGMLRLHREAPLRPVHRYQHHYAFLLYSLAWIGEIKSQLTYLRRGVVTGLDETPSFPRRLASFLAEKAIALLILLPYALALGVGHLAVLLVTAMTVGSVFTALVLVVGHINIGLQAEPGSPVGGRAWAAHLVRTTASFSLDNRVTRWWTGGMTHHLAHHLRPTALRSELPELQVTAVADVVATSGLPEIVYPSFPSAVRHHYLRLRELGRTSPVVAAPVAASSAGVPAPVA